MNRDFVCVINIINTKWTFREFAKTSKSTFEQNCITDFYNSLPLTVSNVDPMTQSTFGNLLKLTRLVLGLQASLTSSKPPSLVPLRCEFIFGITKKPRGRHWNAIFCQTHLHHKRGTHGCCVTSRRSRRFRIATGIKIND